MGLHKAMPLTILNLDGETPKWKRSKEIRKEGGIEKAVHFLVFGDSKHSSFLQDVLHRADLLKPQFCLTMADLVQKGAGEQGVKEYEMLDVAAGWFFLKYPTWPTLGNYEISGMSEGGYESGQ